MNDSIISSCDCSPNVTGSDYIVACDLGMGCMAFNPIPQSSTTIIQNGDITTTTVINGNSKIVNIVAKLTRN